MLQNLKDAKVFFKLLETNYFFSEEFFTVQITRLYDRDVKDKEAYRKKLYQVIYGKPSKRVRTEQF